MEEEKKKKQTAAVSEKNIYNRKLVENVFEESTRWPLNCNFIYFPSMKNNERPKECLHL